MRGGKGWGLARRSLLRASVKGLSVLLLPGLGELLPLLVPSVGTVRRLGRRASTLLVPLLLGLACRELLAPAAWGLELRAMLLLLSPLPRARQPSADAAMRCGGLWAAAAPPAWLAAPTKGRPAVRGPATGMGCPQALKLARSAARGADGAPVLALVLLRTRRAEGRRSLLLLHRRPCCAKLRRLARDACAAGLVPPLPLPLPCWSAALAACGLP